MTKPVNVLPLKGHLFVTFPVTSPAFVTLVGRHYISQTKGQPMLSVLKQFLICP